MAETEMVPFKQINPRFRKNPVTPFFLQLGGQPKALPIDYDQLRMSRQLQISQFGNPSVVQNVFVQALIPLTTKGDTLSRDGNSNNVRIPVGVTDQAFIVDPANANGVRWSDRSWIYNKWRREMGIQTQLNLTPQVFGGTVGGGITGPASWVSDSDGGWSVYPVGPAAFTTNGILLVAGNGEFCRTGQFPSCHFKVKTGPLATDIQNCRLWMAMASTTSAPGVDVPLIDIFGFRFSPTFGDTTWVAYLGNTVASQSLAVGPVVAANTLYKLSMIFTSTTSVSVYVNDSFIATISGGNFPITTQPLSVTAAVNNIGAGTVRSFYFGKCVVNQE